MNRYLDVLAGTGMTFAATAFGAAVVFFFRSEPKERISQLFLGFASGIMIAASVWSLIIPSIEMAQESGTVAWLPAAGGFAFGGVFLFALDRLLPHEHSRPDGCEGIPSGLGHSAMLFFAVTLHNIPEGMAVGLSFAVAGEGGGVSLAAAYALAIGVALQNFPEGAIISLPLVSEGTGKRRAFLYGMLSGVVEPLGALLTIWAARLVVPLLPYLLSFAAGAMMYVVVEELIPEMSEGKHSDTGTILFAVGFVLMMILDVALG